MTKKEYRMALRNAIQDSIENRWRLLEQGESTLRVNHCALCALRNRMSVYGVRCTICPLHDGSEHCCQEWNEYRCGETLKIQMEVANRMIKRLKKINVNEWTKKLNKMGVFE